MWIEYNPNPNELNTTDCTIRALCKALDVDWDTAFLMSASVGFELKRTQENDHVWGTVLKRNGYKRYAIPDTCPDCYTVADFCREHQTGTHVLVFNSHVAVVQGGNLYDAWNSEREYPQFYWSKEE